MREPQRASVSVLHGRPTADELLGAVEELMRGPLLNDVSEVARFQLRVAANVVAMVRREAENGAADEEWYLDALAQLGFADDQELAAAIREGRVDTNRYGPVVELVRVAVSRRVDVTNPGYREG